MWENYQSKPDVKRILRYGSARDFVIWHKLKAKAQIISSRE